MPQGHLCCKAMLCSRCPGHCWPLLLIRDTAGPCSACCLLGPRAFSMELTPSPCQGSAFPGAGLHSGPISCAWGSCQAHQGPSGCQPCPHILLSGPCNSVSSANLMETHPVTFPTLAVIQILKRTAPRTDLCGPRWLPVSMWGATPYPRTSEACCPSRYLPIWLPTSPGCCIPTWVKGFFGNSAAGLAKVKVNDTHCSPLICSSIFFITEDSQA